MDAFIFNPIMNRIYIWSARSQTIGALNGETGERLKPIHDVHGRSIIYNPNNNCLYSILRDSLVSLFVIDCSTWTLIGTIKIRLNPTRDLSFDINLPANKIYITASFYQHESIYTYVIDARINQFIKRLKTSPSIVHHKIRRIAYNYYPGQFSSPIYIINCASDTIVDSILPPPDLQWGSLFVVSEIDRLIAVADSYWTTTSLLHIIDCQTNRIVGKLQLPILARHIVWFTYNSVNNKLYLSVAPGKVYIVDLNSIQIVDSINLGGRLIYNPNTNLLYTLYTLSGPLILVIDGETNRIIDEIPIPLLPQEIILNPISNKLFLHDGFNILIVDCHQRRLERCFKMAYVNQYMMWQPVTNRLYINDVGRDTFSSILTVYDANTHLPLKVINLSSYVEPGEWFYHFTTATRVNKIYLTSGHSRGIYVLDGNTDSLINFIPCEVGGHYLLYSPNQNKLYAIPFTDFAGGSIYIIDCENDIVLNRIDVNDNGNGYLNFYNDKVYATISYGNDVKTFVIDGVGDTVQKILDSLGLPLAFRNKDNVHQVYVGSIFFDRIYVLDAATNLVIDSVMDVPIRDFDDQFFYYDSIDDRIYYPQPCGVIVIDCSSNRIMDTINFPSGQPWGFPEENVWNPISNRFYTYSIYPDGERSSVCVIDCRTNTIIDSFRSLIKPTIMQLNLVNNVVYVNDHWRSKIVAFRDNLIGIKEEDNIKILPELLIYPTIGHRFIIKRKEAGEIKIYDACGRVVRKVKWKEGIIDCPNLTPGVYFIGLEREMVKGVKKFILVK